MDQTKKTKRTKALSLELGREMVRVIEAILFVGTEPFSTEKFSQEFPATTTEEVEQSIELLARRYRQQRRPYRIRRTTGGYVLELLGRYREELLARSRPDRGIKLPRPAIEILSVVAYRQPISRPKIEGLVGIDPRPTLKQLVRRNLIQLVPQEDSEATAEYITTPRFLEFFDLESLEDLPTSAELLQL